jgi:hypothetical protein
MAIPMAAAMATAGERIAADAGDADRERSRKNDDRRKEGLFHLEPHDLDGRDRADALCDSPSAMQFLPATFS